MTPQLSPSLAAWITATFNIGASALRDIGLRDSTDAEIFAAAKAAGATVMTKDSDFVKLQDRLGAPPKIIWLTCGNTSNRVLRELLTLTLPKAIELLKAGDDIVEITGNLP